MLPSYQTRPHPTKLAPIPPYSNPLRPPKNKNDHSSALVAYRFKTLPAYVPLYTSSAKAPFTPFIIPKGTVRA